MRKAIIVLTTLLAACTSTTKTPPPREAALPAPPPLVLPDATRTEREEALARARADYEKNRDSADAIIWLGRRTAYLGRYPEAIDIFSEGIRKHPGDARMYRHRGHRYITLRQIDAAIGDLQKAASLVRGKPDEVEPDGLPNARNVPTGSLQSNICYHLGLAHYLKGDFERARNVYEPCNTLSVNADRLVSTTHWLYMTLRRLGRTEEAAEVLQPAGPSLDVIENVAYHKLVMMYAGDISPDELVREDPATTDGTTILYGVGNWYVYNGQPEKARPIFERIVSGSQWPAFGYIAAEAEIARQTAALRSK